MVLAANTITIDGMPGEAEARRDAVLEDRQHGQAVPRVDALQLWPVDIPEGVRVVVAMMLPVVVMAAEQVAMAVSVPVAVVQLAPCRDTDPATEGDESDAGDRIDPVAEARGECDTGSLNHQPHNEVVVTWPVPAIKAARAVSPFDQLLAPACRSRRSDTPGRIEPCSARLPGQISVGQHAGVCWRA
jgi:hypothetical protein